MQFAQTRQGSLHLLDWTVAVLIMDSLGIHTEPTEEETRLFPPQFDSSTGLDQPSELSLISHLNCL